MIRRLKKDILNQLPPKRRQKIEIDVEFEVFLEDSKEKISVMDNYLKTGLSKIKGIISYLKDILLNKEKLLLFAHHKLVLDAIEKMANKNKIDYIRIDGSTPQEKRFEYINKFQNNKETLIAILSLTAASTGITLTAAKLVVFAELAWTPALLVQAEDRAHRIGQNANFVDIKYLYGRGTLDDEIFKRLEEKNLLINSTLDNNNKEEFIGDKNENILFNNNKIKNDNVLNKNNCKDNIIVEKKNMKKNEFLKMFFNKENKENKENNNNILNEKNDNYLNKDKNVFENYKIHSKLIEKDEMKSASTCLSINKNENNNSKNKINNLYNKNEENLSLSKKEIINLHNDNNKRKKEDKFFFLNNYHKNIKYN
jgi:SWI/SNF-related matrix-associated actin-dependent regulator 1 of chromatin subfamily A